MSHADLSLLLLLISLLLFSAIAMGSLVKLCRVPPVIGELLAGILLGPTLVGHYFPEVSQLLFASSSMAFRSLDPLVNIGGVLLLFVIGLDVRFSQIIEQRRIIASVSVFGFLLPFGLGVAAIFLFPEVWNYSASANRWMLPLVIGTALSITSLPVISRILLDMGLLKSKFGSIIVSSATVDDIVGWICFAIVASFFSPQLTEINPVITIIGVLALAAFSLTTGQTLAGKFLAWTERHHQNGTVFLSGTLIILCMVTAIAVRLGSHAMLGAFLVGVAFSNNGHHKIYAALKEVVLAFFAPLYFVVIGLRVDILQHFDVTLVVLVMAIATLGKVLGAFLGARLASVSARESLAISLGMNSRGAVGIILATSAFQVALIDETVYVALVVMAIVTTLVSGPLMKAVLFANGSSPLLSQPPDVLPAAHR